MEHGFFHPDRGYWQTTNEPPQHVLDGYPEGTVEVPIKPSGNHEWNGSAWVEVTPDPAEQLAEERASMRCRAAAMRLVLHRQGLLATVQGIADSDPEASIVWEHEPEYVRLSPFIDALGGPNGFTPEQIDDLFRAAAAL